MVQKKTKKQIKPVSYWIFIGGVLVLIILLTAVTRRNYLGIKSVWNPFRPTSAPIPTETEILYPERARTNQAIYREKAIKDLAQKLPIDETEIRVISIEETNWPDTSLGCPEKGKFYNQIITPGLFITLGVKDNAYTYHAGLQRVIACDGGN